MELIKGGDFASRYNKHFLKVRKFKRDRIRGRAKNAKPISETRFVLREIYEDVTMEDILNTVDFINL